MGLYDVFASTFLGLLSFRTSTPQDRGWCPFALSKEWQEEQEQDGESWLLRSILPPSSRCLCFLQIFPFPGETPASTCNEPYRIGLVIISLVAGSQTGETAEGLGSCCCFGYCVLTIYMSGAPHALLCLVGRTPSRVVIALLIFP